MTYWLEAFGTLTLPTYEPGELVLLVETRSQALQFLHELPF